VCQYLLYLCLDYVSNKGNSLLNLLTAGDEKFSKFLNDDCAYDMGGDLTKWDADDLVTSPMLAKAVDYMGVVARGDSKHARVKKCREPKNTVGTILVANKDSSIAEEAEKKSVGIAQYADSSRAYSPDSFQNKMSIESSGYWSSESPRSSEEHAAKYKLARSSLNKSLRKEKQHSLLNQRVPDHKADRNKEQEFEGGMNREEPSKESEECLSTISSDQTIQKVFSFQKKFISTLSREVSIDFSVDSLENNQVNVLLTFVGYCYNPLCVVCRI